MPHPTCHMPHVEFKAANRPHILEHPEVVYLYLSRPAYALGRTRRRYSLAPLGNEALNFIGATNAVLRCIF